MVWREALDMTDMRESILHAQLDRLTAECNITLTKGGRDWWIHEIMDLKITEEELIGGVTALTRDSTIKFKEFKHFIDACLKPRHREAEKAYQRDKREEQNASFAESIKRSPEEHKEYFEMTLGLLNGKRTHEEVAAWMKSKGWHKDAEELLANHEKKKNDPKVILKAEEERRRQEYREFREKEIERHKAEDPEFKKELDRLKGTD
jgi:hypothetical protein